MSVALTAACAVACAVLVLAEYLGLRWLRIAAKLAASAAFVALALTLAGKHDHDFYTPGIVLGLMFGALGDAALLGTSKRMFLIGLVAFLIGHVLYVLAIGSILPWRDWLPAAGALGVVPVLASGLVIAPMADRLGRMRGPVIAYVVVITVMVIAAIAVTRARTLPDPNRLCLLIGACLFYVSDISVARDRFVGRSFTNKAWGLPAYYGGQLLITWSLAGLLLNPSA